MTTHETVGWLVGVSILLHGGSSHAGPVYAFTAAGSPWAVASLELRSPPAMAQGAWTASQLSDLLFMNPGPGPSQRVDGPLGFSSFGAIVLSPIGSLDGRTLDSGFLLVSDAVIEPVNPAVDERHVYSFRFIFNAGPGQDSVSGVIHSHAPNGLVRVADFFPTQGDFVLSHTVPSTGSLPLALLGLAIAAGASRRTAGGGKRPGPTCPAGG